MIKNILGTILCFILLMNVNTSLAQNPEIPTEEVSDEELDSLITNFKTWIKEFTDIDELQHG